MLARRWQDGRSLGRTERGTGGHVVLYSSGLGTARTVRMTYGVDARPGHDGEPCRLASDIRAIGGGRTRRYNARGCAQWVDGGGKDHDLGGRMGCNGPKAKVPCPQD
jgi:hypothetical protein